MNKIKIIIFLLLVLIIGFIIFIKNNSQSRQINQPVEKVKANTIVIKNYEFNPKKIVIKKGTTVVFENQDIAKHTITADSENSNAPKSQFIGKGEIYKFTFTTVGVYSYHCDPHPYMKAVIEVIE